MKNHVIIVEREYTIKQETYSHPAFMTEYVFSTKPAFKRFLRNMETCGSVRLIDEHDNEVTVEQIFKQERGYYHWIQYIDQKSGKKFAHRLRKLEANR